MTTRSVFRIVSLAVLCLLAGAVSPGASAQGVSAQGVSIEYYFDRGPVPPQYHFEYGIGIDVDGAGVLSFKNGAGESWTEEFSLSNDQRVMLVEQIAELRLLQREWTETLDRPSGGGSDQVVLRPTDGEAVEVPQHLSESEQRLARQEWVRLLHFVLPAELLQRLPSPMPERYPRPTRHPPPTAVSRSLSI